MNPGRGDGPLRHCRGGAQPAGPGRVLGQRPEAGEEAGSRGVVDDPVAGGQGQRQAGALHPLAAAHHRLPGWRAGAEDHAFGGLITAVKSLIPNMPRLLIVKAPAGELRWRQPASPYCGARLPSAAPATPRGLAAEAPTALTGLSGHHQSIGRELVRADPAGGGAR